MISPKIELEISQKDNRFPKTKSSAISPEIPSAFRLKENKEFKKKSAK